MVCGLQILGIGYVNDCLISLIFGTCNVNRLANLSGTNGVQSAGDGYMTAIPPGAQNGRKVTADMKFKILEEKEVYTLLILEPTADDSGSYECVSINKNGEARCQGQVGVTADVHGRISPQLSCSVGDLWKDGL